MFGRCRRCTEWTIFHAALALAAGTLVWRDLDRDQAIWVAVDLLLVAANAWYAEQTWTRCALLEEQPNE